MNTFGKIWSTSLVLLAMACTTPATNPTVITDEDEDRVRELQVELIPNAYDERDTASLSQFLHEKFQLIDDNGDAYTKKDEMEYVANFGPSYSEFEFEIADVRFFENGTAVIRGKGTMKGVDDQSAYITTYKSSNVFIKVGSDWKAINSHVSGVKEERYDMAPEN